MHLHLVTHQGEKIFKAKNFSKRETKENTAQQQAENFPQDIVFLFCLYAVAMAEFFKNKTLTKIQKHRFTALTKAFFMPVLEAPPPPAVMTNPVLGSTLMEYRGKGALYKSGTFLFHIVVEKVCHAFSKEQTAAFNHTYEITIIVSAMRFCGAASREA